MLAANRDPEQLVRDQIDKMLIASGWLVQPKKQINLSVNKGVAVREYQTNVGPPDYILFVNKKPLGVIVAKRGEERIHSTVHEDQTEGYANAKLGRINNAPLVFAYESTGEVTSFTDYRDPKPRSRPVFTFHRPETSKNWLQDGNLLRTLFFELPALPLTGLRDCQVEATTNPEKSFKQFKSKALGQMASGSDKTFTAITSIYCRRKLAKAKRILFSVNTKNLGERVEQEFKPLSGRMITIYPPKRYGFTHLSSLFISK